MAAHPISNEKREKILVDWRMGKMSQEHISQVHKVSKGAVNAICKGVEQDGQAIVTVGVQYKQELAKQDDRMMTAVVNEVDERTRHVLFFQNATLKNVSLMMTKVTANMPVLDHQRVQATLKDGKEVVLGKQPDVAVQINNNLPPNTGVDYSKLKDDDLEQLERIALAARPETNPG
jgi:hypothetical protein